MRRSLVLKTALHPALWGSSTVGEQCGLKRKGFVDVVRKGEELGGYMPPRQPLERAPEGLSGGAGPEGGGAAETLRPAGGRVASSKSPSRQRSGQQS